VRLQFFGATRSVSGSLHVLQSGGQRWLLDCGLYQGRRQDMYDRNAALPCAAGDVAGVLLSHAHVDHSGRLPRLVHEGFRGPIYATQATIALCELLLADSAYVLSSQTALLNQRRTRRGLPPLPELYDAGDVSRTLEQMVAVEWDVAVQLGATLAAVFRPAGHILGASLVELTERTNEGACTLTFSGDLGREDNWVLPDPAVPERSNYVLLESTYGDRCHRPYAFARSELAACVRATLEQDGIVVIPAFSVGRTQRLIYELRELVDAGEIPETEIYLDSPLSIEALRSFVAHRDAWHTGVDGDAICARLVCSPVVSAEDSARLVASPGPYIVVTASGMCEAGRVLHHLQRNLPRAGSRIVFVGFCAEDTLGRHLIDGDEEVRVSGETLRVHAGIDYFDAFSAHADQAGLRAWIAAQPGVQGVFLVHGEEGQSFSLAEHLEQDGPAEIVVPFAGEVFELSPHGMHCIV
jgi:metallo-beta-lactamase family protein